MLKIILVIFILFSFFGCNEYPKPISDDRNNDYALYDERGDFHRFSYYNNSKAIVLFVQGNGCPIVRNAIIDYHSIILDYSETGFIFFMINSNIQDSRESINKESINYGFKIPVLVDSAQLIADELDIKITAEVIILHPITREILYRGPINDRLDYEVQKNKPSATYLRDALDAILKNKKLESRKEMARGCKVTRLSLLNENTKETYTNDIAPILEKQCVKCHNDGGIAPWSMSDYKTITGWSAMIKQVLLSKRMPPWKADPEVGEFQNSFAIEDSNVRKIISWIDNGLEYGKGLDILTQIPPLQGDWKEGIPDEVIVLKEEIIPASKLIPYRYQKITLDLSSDTWLRGVEIKPGNTKVVHHIVLTNTDKNKQSPITSRKQRPWTDNFIALAGGADQVTFFPKGTGVFIPQGTSLTVQIHYTSTGKIEKDQTKIGFYYHKDVPEKEFYALSPSNTDFEIPPFGKNILLTSEDVISKDIKIYYVAPHMHYRGKSIKFKVLLPNNSIRTIVSVPDYNFNWQWLYKLKEPISIPKGSKIIVEGIYDNTYQNPLNPDPTKELHYGIHSTDEMLIGFFNYTIEED